MELTYFTVSNFRSITTAYKIDLKDITIFIGKNNEGKSNLINAIRLAMEILYYTSHIARRILPPQLYLWAKDFPISLQSNKRMKNKSTDLRLDFKFSEDEVKEFSEKVGSNINGDLSISIKIKQDSAFSITVPKKGKDATSLSSKIRSISQFVCDRISIQYIPAIRSESDAYDVISNIIAEDFSQIDDPEYIKAQEYILNCQKRKLEKLSQQIKEPLATFMPNVKKVTLSLENRMSSNNNLKNKNLQVFIDDGVSTALSFKGDGVKSLTTMAILSKTTAKNRVIIIDEPEAHLHPDAIHYLKSVLFKLSNYNQLIISTHSPIFVNRSSVSSNIIIENHKAEPAERISEIRKALGVKTSDNLMYSDYVIVVEGPSDKDIIERFITEDKYLDPLLKNSTITIRSIGGVNNLHSELYNLEQYLCNYIVLLDNDSAGKDKANEVKSRLNISGEKFRYFIISGYRECELEDMYKIEYYKDYINDTYQINVLNNQFKNKSKKWSKRIVELATLTGQIFSEEQINEIKSYLSSEAKTKPISEVFTDDSINLMKEVIRKIKKDVSDMLK